MTLLEAIQNRHSVRKYKNQPLSAEAIEILTKEINICNREANLHIQLITNEPKAFSGLMAYGQFSGVTSYLVMAGAKSDDLEENIGYYGEHLVLLAQTLGINSCWAAVTFKKIPGTYTLHEGEKILCYIALGYGETEGTAHKIKAPEDVSNASDLTPKWFNRGVSAALLAPTAVNQQKFKLTYQSPKGDCVHRVKATTTVSVIGYTKIDLGIVKYHFEVGAGKENFEWA